jgi:hypothetical protein
MKLCHRNLLAWFGLASPVLIPDHLVRYISGIDDAIAILSRYIRIYGSWAEIWYWNSYTGLNFFDDFVGQVTAKWKEEVAIAFSNFAAILNYIVLVTSVHRNCLGLCSNAKWIWQLRPHDDSCDTYSDQIILFISSTVLQDRCAMASLNQLRNWRMHPAQHRCLDTSEIVSSVWQRYA